MDIIIQNLCKSFEDKQVIKNLNATFVQGKTTCIMGKSGIGKTTLLQIIAGIQKADSGQIFGTNNMCFSAVFQEDRLISHLNAIDNVRIVLPNTANALQIQKALLATGLAPQDLNQPVATLSGGQKRRVAIVRAMMANSNIILLDEPFKGLDLKTTEKAIQYVISAKANRTILCITHEQSQAKALRAQILQLG